MKKIGLFSGSFNPIHVGHVELARHMLMHLELDEVWLVVSPCNPFKVNQALLSEHVRLQMVELAVAHEERMKGCDVEFGLPKPSYTVQTLRTLTEQHPEVEFTLIIGGDNWVAFDRWKDYQYIMAHYPIAVYPRAGQLLPERKDEAMKRLTVVEAPLFPISSTEIRTMVQHEQDCSQWLHSDVAAFIEKEGLYE